MTLLLRLLFVLAGAGLFGYSNHLYQETPDSYANVVLILIIPFLTALLVELAPFDRQVGLKGNALPPVAILGLLFLVTWIAFSRGDWLHTRGLIPVFAGLLSLPALALVSTFMGLLLAKSLTTAAS